MNTEQPIPSRMELAAILMAGLLNPHSHFSVIRTDKPGYATVALELADELIKQNEKTNASNDELGWQAWSALNASHAQTLEELLEVRAENEKLKAELAEMKRLFADTGLQSFPEEEMSVAQIAERYFDENSPAHMKLGSEIRHLLFLNRRWVEWYKARNAEKAKLMEALEGLLTTVTFADPPKEFNGVLCHEVRVPVEFVEHDRAALTNAKGGQE